MSDDSQIALIQKARAQRIRLELKKEIEEQDQKLKALEQSQSLYEQCIARIAEELGKASEQADERSE